MGPAHRSFNCMAMPKEHPAALRYAATTAVALAHFQIEDRVADSGRLRWKAVKRFFSPAYRKAAADLRASGFPLEEKTAMLATQNERERRAFSLEDVAEPTALVTEMVFGHGAAELASIWCTCSMPGRIGRAMRRLGILTRCWHFPRSMGGRRSWPPSRH